MTSIIKVDQIQTAAGGVPTVGDLGVSENPKAIFYAYPPSNISGSSAAWLKISSGLTIAVDNDSAWDDANYRWVAPRDGNYQIQVNHLSSGQAHSAVYLNGSSMRGNHQSHSRQGETGYNATSGINNIISLTSGDYIEFYNYIIGGGYIYSEQYSAFSITQL